MPPAHRRRFARLRATTAVLAAANLLAGAGALLAAGLGDEPAPDGRTSAVLPASAPVGPATVLAASVHPLLATTTTTTAARPEAHRPSTRRARGDADVGDTRQVDSTGYCLDGTTTSGAPVGPGMVAMNGVPLGSRWLVHEGPFAGTTLEVTDRIGHSSDFDIWFAACDDARAYGRRTVTVERTG